MAEAGPRFDQRRCIDPFDYDGKSTLPRQGRRGGGSRLGNEKTNQFPEIVAALQKWARRLKEPVVLDGEVVALDERGDPTGFQQLQGRIHVEDAAYAHDRFRPWRLVALVLKALRRLRPDYPIWRDFPYEYERGRLAIDVINGSELLRRWVDDPAATPEDLEALAAADEAAWQDECEAVRLYA